MTITGIMMQAVAFAMSVLIIRYAEPMINHMNIETAFSIRWGHILLCGGAIGQAIGVVSGTVPDRSEVLVLVGIVTVLFFNRRRRAL